MYISSASDQCSTIKGSAALITADNARGVCFCTDDRHPGDLLTLAVSISWCAQPSALA